MKYITFFALLMVFTNTTVNAETIRFSGAIVEFTCSEIDTQASCVSLRQFTTNSNISRATLKNIQAKVKNFKSDIFTVSLQPIANNQQSVVILANYY